MGRRTSVALLFWRLTEGHRKRYALALLAQVGVNVLGLFPPLALGARADSISGKAAPPHRD
jgi:hypothetical protein